MAAWRNIAASMAALTIVVAACSSDDDDAGGATSTTQTPSTGVASAGDSGAPATGEPSAPATAAPGSVASTAAPTPPPTPVSPSTGVPGLDSDDSFCAAWSRFGGSWQVLVQAGAFGDPAEAARLEVIASTLVGDAYDDVFAAWPTELASERDVVAEEYFGAFQRRSADAAGALAEAGASDDDVAALAAAWSAALESYDPLAPTIAVAVPAELEQTVSDATAAFTAQRVPLANDPSMVITAATPLTDAFLATACPDQGWIVGQDVDE